MRQQPICCGVIPVETDDAESFMKAMMEKLQENNEQAAQSAESNGDDSCYDDLNYRSKLEFAAEMIQFGIAKETVCEKLGLTEIDLVEHKIIEPTAKDYLIPVTWQMQGFIRVKGILPEDAITLALMEADGETVPDDAAIVKESFTIETDPRVVQMYTDLKKSGALTMHSLHTHLVSDAAKKAKVDTSRTPSEEDEVFDDIVDDIVSESKDIFDDNQPLGNIEQPNRPTAAEPTEEEKDKLYETFAKKYDDKETDDGSFFVDNIANDTSGTPSEPDLDDIPFDDIDG